jgi:hypothetical protein
MVVLQRLCGYCGSREIVGADERHDCADGMGQLLGKRPDTVGQPPRTAMGMSNIPSLKVKKLRKLPQETVLLEL